MQIEGHVWVHLRWGASLAKDQPFFEFNGSSANQLFQEWRVQVLQKFHSDKGLRPTPWDDPELQESRSNQVCFEEIRESSEVECWEVWAKTSKWCVHFLHAEESRNGQQKMGRFERCGRDWEVRFNRTFLCESLDFCRMCFFAAHIVSLLRPKVLSRTSNWGFDPASSRDPYYKRFLPFVSFLQNDAKNTYSEIPPNFWIIGIFTRQDKDLQISKTVWKRTIESHGKSLDRPPHWRELLRPCLRFRTKPRALTQSHGSPTGIVIVRRCYDLSSIQYTGQTWQNSCFKTCFFCFLLSLTLFIIALEQVVPGKMI